ncbi:MAG: hypothetical protein M1829_003776 [Trizodia sp. TS-e1964]|nr:MAG: hypothetical protein M1829_003776 [Trizodia sp. TS-e1964]
MSSNNISDPIQAPPAASRSKKSSKRKKGAVKAQANGGETEEQGISAANSSVPGIPNGSPAKPGFEEDVASIRPEIEALSIRPKHPEDEEETHVPSIALNGNTQLERNFDLSETLSKEPDASGHFDGITESYNKPNTEIEILLKSIQEADAKHSAELSKVQEELKAAKEEKEVAQTQYQNLLAGVNRLRSQLQERLKDNAEELTQARTQIEDLEEQNRILAESNTAIETELARFRDEVAQSSKELSSLRNRNNLSQQNWIKEREDLVSREASTREEFEKAWQAMSEWEVLALEERTHRENLAERNSELEEQLLSHKEAFEKASSERDSYSLTVDGLQRALKEIQNARKQELRGIVENTQSQIEELKRQLLEAEQRALLSESSLEELRKELQRASTFEKEVKEKNLLIGKLRHEAVILNEYLTKALRVLKKGKPEDNIDRQIVTNHFLQFLVLDRSDPKKFQILQIIAGLLNWTEEQREQAGLARPGGSNNTLRVPLSPFHRTPSTPSLSTELNNETGTSKESLADLWSNFLEQEADHASKSSRSASISSAAKPSAPS